MNEQTESLLQQLLLALQTQSEAITRLAASNEALIDLLVEQQEVDSEATPLTYLDGSLRVDTL